MWVLIHIDLDIGASINMGIGMHIAVNIMIKRPILQYNDWLEFRI